MQMNNIEGHMNTDVDGNMECYYCGKKVCLWKTVGSKLVNMVGEEWNLELRSTSPRGFCAKVYDSLIPFTADKKLPYCCEQRVEDLFPNQKILRDFSDEVSANDIGDDEYDVRDGPFWGYEEELFNRL